MSREWRRREVLRAATATAAAAAAASCFGCGSPPPRSPPLVHLARCPSYDAAPLRRALEASWSAIGAPSPRGRRVLVKPNFVEYRAGAPVTTDLRLLAEFLGLLRDLGASDLTVAEGPGHRRDSEEVWLSSGLRALVERMGARLVDLNYDDVSALELPLEEGRTSRFWLPVTVLEADLRVTLPKLKTHHWMGATLSLKNVFGIVPGMRYGWPKNVLHWMGIERAIVALNRAVRFHVGLLDGVVAMEGDGPLAGTPVDLGLVLAGQDLVALDEAAGAVMGFAPAELPYLQRAAAAGLGQLGATVWTGLKPADVARPFKRAPSVPAG